MTGLPRAGTTLMLELLYATGEFQSFRYSDMPFILAPLLWNRISRSSRKAGQMQERAHGDGMKISVDSPEAFDEVVWLTYLAKKIVREDRLLPISPEDVDVEVRDAIRNSVRKVLALAKQSDPDARQLRYLSKNNANISRIGTLLQLFPTSKILVVFRNPLAQIRSLARQHERFLEEHARDTFSQKYMKWIGHYEFGANFKPINFGGWMNGTEIPSRIDEAFWLSYWNAAYTYALEHRSEEVQFVDFDQLLNTGTACLTRIADMLSLESQDALIDAGKRLRSPATKSVNPGVCPADVWKRAQETHAKLRSIAI